MTTHLPRIAPLAAALGAACIAASLAACTDSTGPDPSANVSKINHIVVLYLENRSFDNMYGEFPGAEGLAAARAEGRVTQVDMSGAPYATLPQLANMPFPSNMPNAPFDIGLYVPATMRHPDLIHRYYQEQAQIDGGKMDKFTAVSDAKGLTVGYYHTMQFPVAAEAQKYTLADHFFHSAFGGSFLNHIFFVAAAPPVFPNAPTGIVAQLDASGSLVKDGQVTPDGYVVNTSYSVNMPHPASANPAALVPNQTMPTIGDRLTDAGRSWVWYSGGYADALAGRPDPLFQFHHQPFVYFARYADGTAAKAEHLKDEADFVAAAKAGTLPAVAFVKPIGTYNEHPGYADIISGENHTIELINAVRNGPNWKDCAIIVTYDENGGLWDHVAPPAVDKWGPGTRVPTVVISPYAKKGYVDHTTYETTSILAFIEKRYGLPPLGTHDAQSADMLNAFDFSQTP